MDQLGYSGDGIYVFLHVSYRPKLCRDLQLVSDHGWTLLLGLQNETRLSNAWLLYRVGLFYRNGLHRNLWKPERCPVYRIDGGSWLGKDPDESGNCCNSFGDQHLVGHHKYRRNESMSSFNVWWTLGGTFVLVVTLLVKSPVKNSARFVFTDFEDASWISAGGLRS